MLSLGVDTSNYATSLAVVRRGEVVCALKRFLPVKDGELGLRQSDAVFQHTVALPELLCELREQADLSRLGAVGVSARPRPVRGSYMPCFLAGVAFAEALAAPLGLRAVRTSHQQGHLAAALLGAGEPRLYSGKLLFFHLSGGTTELLLTEGFDVLAKLGGSLDLHAGQLVDRLGVKLGFAFPAGARVSALAARCGEAVSPKISVKGMDCHLSGLQNQAEALLAQGKPPEYAARWCLVALARTVAAVLREALRLYPGLPVLCAGGVMASDVVRAELLPIFDGIRFVPPELSADNAAGVALIASGQGQAQGA